jgi:sugar lactone lactonase YvrE
MFEGQRVLRLSPAGEVLREVRLPVRCPTMPCFGGSDLKTLYITTAREKRPPEELARQPLAGCVLALAVDVPGLPVHLAGA